MNPPVTIRTLTDGGQTPPEVAAQVAEFLDGAKRTLELAQYDFDLGPETAAIVGDAIRRAHDRGVRVRLAYNVDHRKPIPVPPPPSPDQTLIETLPVEATPIAGVPDLMHHKFVVRDDESVWTGSTNWTADSWTREENVIVTADSAELATRYTTDFDQLWQKRDVEKSGKVDSNQFMVDGKPVRAWFCPGRGERLAHRIAKAIGTAQRRIRIASPVISSGPILGTLAQVASDGKVDLAGVVDATQIAEVLRQWHMNGNASWKEPLLRSVLTRAPFSGKRSTPYAPGAVHDYMHAKVTIADDVVFVGSFNLSHSGEENAENVLEIADPALAERLAAFVDKIRGRYPGIEL
jgi:phosphatidylserine/phosphatidylglycerophosphate/cardiolipin synthase-like enzyme